MGFDQELFQNDCAKEAPGCDNNNSKLHQEAYEANSLLPVGSTAAVAAGWYPTPFPTPVPNPYDRIAQEGRILGAMLDSGNFVFAQQRLQADLYQLRPDRYAQNLLLNNVNLYDRKGIGSDLQLGSFNPYTQSFTHGYIIQSVFRPYPTYPVWY